MVFCNNGEMLEYYYSQRVTILILVDGFLQFKDDHLDLIKLIVTILILVDGFLQYDRLPEGATELPESQSLF